MSMIDWKKIPAKPRARHDRAYGVRLESGRIIEVPDTPAIIEVERF